MPSNKDRLYVALFARSGRVMMPGGEDKYHWALIVRPKEETSSRTRYQLHVKDSLRFVGDPPEADTAWRFEEVDITANLPQRLLVYILVAKVRDTAGFRRLAGKVPLRPHRDGWNCVEWVQETLAKTMETDGVLGRHIDAWQLVRDTAMEYVKRKKDEGRFDISYDPLSIPTWDMLSSTEIVI